ncbi:MAG: hypothetical protein M3Z08_17215 [Chloroflexota bacterium]|nr:hypothetical protein [Chloroflexota bacterium]
MEAMQSYDGSIFETLAEFRIARQFINTNRERLKELGVVICQHSLQEDVGISLLHKHFHISPYERVTKAFVGNAAHIRPQPIQDADHVAPYLWKLEANKGNTERRYYPLEFIEITDKTTKAQEQAERVRNTGDFLQEMAAKLCELEVENIFGISTLHNAGGIVVGDDEMLLETTDQVNRVLTVAPIPQTELVSSEVTETTWQFTSVGEGKTVQECYMHCNQHCKGHYS